MLAVAYTSGSLANVPQHSGTLGPSPAGAGRNSHTTNVHRAGNARVGPDQLNPTTLTAGNVFHLLWRGPKHHPAVFDGTRAMIACGIYMWDESDPHYSM